MLYFRGAVRNLALQRASLSVPEFLDFRGPFSWRTRSLGDLFFERPLRTSGFLGPRSRVELIFKGAAEYGRLRALESRGPKLRRQLLEVLTCWGKSVGLKEAREAPEAIPNLARDMERIGREPNHDHSPVSM